MNTNLAVSPEAAKQLVASVPHWHHTFEIAPGIWTPGAYDPRDHLNQLKLPPALDCNVLDIGTSDGFFALSLQRRGARVTCVDYRPKDQHGFGVMEKVTGHKFDYRQANLFDLKADSFGGPFDIVLFLGVLYHLPDMFAGLRVVRSLCRGRMFLETYCEDHGDGRATARYCVADSLNGDLSNFWAPNERCVLDMLSDVGFSVLRSEKSVDRLFVECAAAPIPYKAQVAYAEVPS